MAKLMVVFAPNGGEKAALEPPTFEAALAPLGPAPLTVNVARTTDDLTPRDHLPRALFEPPASGVAALVEYWTPDGVSPHEAFEVLAGAGRVAGVGTAGGYVTSENVVLDFEQTWADGQPTEGLKMISIGRRNPAMTVEHFEHHWRTIHGPLALRHHVGMCRYVQNLVVGRLGAARADVDSIAELSFRTVDDFLNRLYDSREGRRIIAADANTFGGGGDTHFLVETIVHARQRDA